MIKIQVNYIKIRDKLISCKKLKLIDKKVALFNNWQDYIDNSVIESNKRHLRYQKEQVNIY